MARRHGGRNPRIVALFVWLIAMSVFEGAVLFLATTNPHGLASSPAIDSRNLAQVEPLYGAARTGDQAIAWSPNGASIAVVGESVLTILDAASGREDRAWPLQGYAEAVAWSPDGAYIAVSTLESLYGPIRLTVYSDQGADRGSWIAHDNYGAEGLAWSPDGSRLLSTAGGHGGQFAIWETGSWRELLRRDDVLTTGSSASWSPDGTRFALGGVPVSVFEASSGSELWND